MDASELLDTPQRQSLHRQLQALDSGKGDEEASLTDIYIGALRVLNDQENPDLLALSAHSFREVLEELIRRDLARQGKTWNPFYITNKIITLLPKLEGHIANSIALLAIPEVAHLCPPVRHPKKKIPEENSPILLDEDARAFLKEVGAFFSEYDESTRTRKERAKGSIRQLLHSRGVETTLTQLDSDKNIWHELYSEFSKIAHHDKESDSKNEHNRFRLKGLVETFEGYLLRLLTPSPSEDFDEIDRLPE